MGEIADALVYYANVYTAPGGTRAELMDEASRIFRQKASLLRVRAHTLPCYRCFAWLGLVPQWESILKVSGNLIGLSNSVHQGDADSNEKRRDEITQILGLPPLRT